ncbi:PIN domain-containing protein [Bacteroides xylanisolvens]|uniref:AAA domain-containing protein n=1 Tax=Bacteroides xylanisolvens TaxID=371601 RepID=UPI002307E37A|nr:AAA domain-containing protein [Bacteroides xylanisolvens]MDB0716069.1 PIN domain-containing protein [Bacteroides xylanisolvens]MDB0736136.1 PIN domain-containing protein [Bacteroides xylanisolvens]
MYYTREKHKRFLDKELQAISENYIRVLNTKATALLSENEVYVAQFMKVDLEKDANKDDVFNGSGQVVLKFKKDKGIPRKNEYFTALLLDGDKCLPRNWGNLSWAELRKFQVEYSEVHCVWQGKANDNGFLLCGFNGMSMNMAKYLKEKNLSGCVIVLGPQEPPMEYYQNLISFISNTSACEPAAKILDFNDSGNNNGPSTINDDDTARFVTEEIENHAEVIIQGPPGTGKTYMMASIIKHLLDKQKSVLVTALTNRALIELACKESLDVHRSNKNVMKTNVSSDEICTCKNLVPLDSKAITSIKGKLTLTTFYNASAWAKDSLSNQPTFDYVIMDEASQALFAMIAACKRLGSKVVWIGDQEQLPPIISLSEETMVRNDYGMLANGFGTLCDKFEYSYYMLTKTYRLLPKSASLTSIFYNEPLVPVNMESKYNSNLSYIDKEGGSCLRLVPMPVGEKADLNSCQYVISLVSEILSENPKASIAVIAKFRASVRMLQNCFITKFGAKENVLIDTVERIQGMTCDYCLFYIPNAMMQMSLDKSLFNVATSRATCSTIIIANPSIFNTICDKRVKSYLEVLSLPDIPLIETNVKGDDTKPQGIGTEAHIGLKVVGKLDLSKFQRKMVEIQPDKTNIYIIDTNVFVNCPNIISKIDKQYQVSLSAKVVDELDKLKVTLNLDGKKNVQDAIRNINLCYETRDLTMEIADVSLLPADFNPKSPDNQILSVALKLKNNKTNPIILTSDNGLQLKSKGLGITTISLKDFLKKPK